MKVKILDNFPFVSREISLKMLRIAVAFIFITHAAVRVADSTVGQFGEFLEANGFPAGVVWVWAITTFEIIGGLLLAFGYFARILSAGFIFLLVVGIVLIHAKLGWFVGEHGTGGCEYSFILIAALIVIAASDQKQENYYNAEKK